MRKRWLLILPGLVAIGLVAFWLHQTGIVLGWLRGEAFYQGRPTNYWSRELAGWNYCFALVDLDADGWPDIFIANDGLDGNGAVPAKLFHNNGDGTFTNVSGLNGGEGLVDIFVANDVFHNNGDGTFTDVSGLNGGYSRVPGLIDKVAGRFGMTLDSADVPALLRGDPAAEAVLRELLDDADPQVRAHAKRGLNQIRRANP